MRYHGGIRRTDMVTIMKFEHLIEINDPLNPLIDALSIEQLWRGLVLRAESPKLFVPHLDDCVIDERTEHGFRRRLRYGELVIEDRVVLEPMRQVRYEVAAQQDISQSSLTMTIETPTEDALFVRFQYEDGHDAATDAANAALRDMLLEARTTLDSNLAALMIRELGIYPIGTYVRLISGEVGVVARRGLQSTTPHVESVLGPRGAPLDLFLQRDTRNELHTIREVLTNAQVAALAAPPLRMEQVWGRAAAL